MPYLVHITGTIPLIHAYHFRYGRRDTSHARIFYGFVFFLLLVLSIPLMDLGFVHSSPLLSSPAMPAFHPSATNTNSDAIADTSDSFKYTSATPARFMRGTPLSLLLTLAAVGAAGAVDASVQGSLFGMAGELSERYVQALVAGTSASGITLS